MLEAYEKTLVYNSSFGSRVVYFIRQVFSPNEWKVWLIGGGTGDVGGGTNNRFPFILNTSSTFLAGTLFPLRFLVEKNYDKFADKSGVLLFAIFTYAVMIFCFVMIYTTNPGILAVYEKKKNFGSQRRSQHCATEKTRQLSSQTLNLQEKYRQVLENLGRDNDEPQYTKPALCHSCHIVRPTRSKHCRVMRRCVLMFDHFCPFVGNTIGLYNYLYFYLYCVFFVLADFGIMMMSLLYHRRVGFDWYNVLVSTYVGLYVFPSFFMVVYHSQLIRKNLTTNEHENAFRYEHFKDENGRFQNPFDQGILHNCYIRCFPGKSSYELPQNSHESNRLINGDNLV